MLLAILKNIDNNKKYNIYIDKSNNKFVYKIKCNDGLKIYYLKKDEVYNLLLNLFSYEKKYVDKYKDYEIFVDQCNNKHFLKSDYENINLFFENNGILALMNLGKKNKNNIPKTFSLKSKDGISYVLTCSMLFLSLTYLHVCLDKPINVSFSEYIESEITDFYNIIDIKPEEIKNKINNSSGLTDEEKEYLINDNLFNDITDVLKNTRNEELRERLTNVTKVYFTEEELNLEEKKDTIGYYNCLQPNFLHIRNDKVSKDVLSHEFIHLLQDSNNYHFLREAMAEILNEEYYGEKINSYYEEIKYTKILLEMISPESVFKCCFSGDTSEFEQEIKNKLSPEYSSKLLELLSVNPSDCDNISQVYKDIKYLLSKMYNEDLEENDLFYTILYFPENVHKKYFNKYYIEKSEEDDLQLVYNIPLKEAINKGLVDITCEAITIEEVTEEEFKLLPEDLKFMEYDLKDGYILDDMNIISLDGKEKYTIKEAMEAGLIKDLIFYKRIIIYDIPLDDAIKYRNDLVENYSSHITLLGNREDIKIHGIVTYKYIKNVGLQPYIDFSYINNKSMEHRKLN